jgi:hypothetical protein
LTYFILNLQLLWNCKMSRRRRNDYDDLCSSFQNLSFDSRPCTNPNIININPGCKPVWYKNLHPSDDAYQEICDLIAYDDLVVENIVEVHNSYLKKAYHKKKRAKRFEYGQVSEGLFFHGTVKANLDSICTYNFDWRLYGSSTGHKFGKGVSFSPSAKYASHYSHDTYHKVMIVANVLIGRICEGYKDMTVPPRGFDTSQNDKETVIVKYDDNEFYPSYKLYYHL